jgi:anti-sigma B factor antagonist
VLYNGHGERALSTGRDSRRQECVAGLLRYSTLAYLGGIPVAIWDRWRGTRQTGNGAARLLREPLEVQEVVSGDDHTLVLSGELDMAGEDKLEAAIVSCANAARLTLDLSQLSFMDSTGITLILLAEDLCKARGIVFSVVPGPRQVQRVFEVAGLVGQLPFEMERTA